MPKGKWKPTVNIAQLIHILYQIENLTGYTADDLLDILLSGNASDNIKSAFLNTFKRLKDQPVDIGINAAIYAMIYKIAKKHIGPMVGRIDMGFFYLKPI